MVTLTRVDDCVNCGQRIELVHCAWQVDRGTYRDPGGDLSWMHVGGGAVCPDGHGMAAPQARCPNCRSTNYKHDETDPWANYDRCGDCGYEYRFSLGD